MKRRLCIAVSLLVLFLSQDLLNAREWEDTSGKFSVEAELVEVRGDQVFLKKSNDETISVPVAKLSLADRAYLKAIAGNSKVAPGLANNEVASLIPRKGQLVKYRNEYGGEFFVEVIDTTTEGGSQLRITRRKYADDFSVPLKEPETTLHALFPGGDLTGAPRFDQEMNTYIYLASEKKKRPDVRPSAELAQFFSLSPGLNEKIAKDGRWERRFTQTPQGFQVLWELNVDELVEVDGHRLAAVIANELPPRKEEAVALEDGKVPFQLGDWKLGKFDGDKKTFTAHVYLVGKDGQRGSAWIVKGADRIKEFSPEERGNIKPGTTVATALKAMELAANQLGRSVKLGGDVTFSFKSDGVLSMKRFETRDISAEGTSNGREGDEEIVVGIAVPREESGLIRSVLDVAKSGIGRLPSQPGDDDPYSGDTLLIMLDADTGWPAFVASMRNPANPTLHFYRTSPGLPEGLPPKYAWAEKVYGVDQKKAASLMKAATDYFASGAAAKGRNLLIRIQKHYPDTKAGQEAERRLKQK